MKIKTIDKEFSTEFKVMNSKFIAVLQPFRDKSRLTTLLQLYRKEHPKANHICYAYRIGFEEEEVRANDDGEPSGTAGKPILNQLYSYEVKNCILLVIRYFGGTKLGVPGLIEAYKTAAKQCLEKAHFIEVEDSDVLDIEVDEFTYHKFIKWLKNNKINIVNSLYTEGKYTLKLDVPKSSIKGLNEFLG